MKCFIIFLFCSVAVFSQNATKEDIKTLRTDIIRLENKMDKRFNEAEQRFDKNLQMIIHQIDKRFEQMHQQFNILIGFLTILSTAFMGSVAYVNRKTNTQGEKLEKLSKLDIKEIIGKLENSEPHIKEQFQNAIKT